MGQLRLHRSDWDKGERRQREWQAQEQQQHVRVQQGGRNTPGAQMLLRLALRDGLISAWAPTTIFFSSLPSEWLQISRGSSVFPFPSLKRRLGPDSMENNCLQCCLEKLLEIPFLFCDMSKLSIFQLFLSVGNLTPEHKCFFLAKLKSPLFQLNRTPDRRTQTDTCGGHAILCLGPLSLNSPKGFSTFCAWNFHFVTD